MKSGLKIIVAVLIVLVLAGSAAYWSIRERGFSTRDQPTALEAFLARRLRQLAMPAGASEMKNPVPLTEQVLTEARAHFADHCALCHGNDGKGQTSIGQRFYPKTPDMTLPATQSLTDGELFYVIKNGIRLTGMPAWGEDTPEDDRESWQLVHFIRHVPELTPVEIEQMKELNPVTRAELEEQEQIRRFLAGEPISPPKHHH